jgi:hypothetical protein
MVVVKQNSDVERKKDDKKKKDDDDKKKAPTPHRFFGSVSQAIDLCPSVW